MSPILTLLEVYAFAHLVERVKLAWIFGSHKASAVFRFGYSLKALLFSSLSTLVMECNKDEALRAKQIAEKKMETNDFEGARKVALKAQNLFPELENIRQLLSVCDVHCSAQNTLTGSEKDWYGILQVERLADDLMVKKQYRRLALFLHPDKNQFPGAEAAFKLICEAYALLSDPQKKSLYDTKLRVIVRSAPVHPPPHHINKNSQFSMQFTPVFTDHFSRLSQHHATQSNNTRMGIFCTICPYCSLKHQYERKFLNTVLHCQKCFKNFLGYEIGSRKSGQGGTQVHVDLGVSQSAGFQERVGPNECQFSVGIQNMASSAADGGSQQNTSFKAVQPSRVSNGERVQGTAKGTGNFQAKAAGNGNVNTSRGGRRTGKLYRDTTDSKKRDLKNKSRKGNKRYVVESSDTCNSSSESDIELVNQPVDLASIPSHVQFPRRSSRKRTNVSYHEDDNDDDVNIALERSQESNADCSRTQNKDIGSSRVGESPERKVGDQDEKVKVREETSVPTENGATPIEIDSDSDLDSCLSPDTDNNSYECAEPEFSDFDKARDENCFAVDQFWACYDETDGMPRFYAKVKKVSASPFELSITWLEGDLMNKNTIDVPLPLGCGCFKLGATVKTSRRLMFSHQIHFDRGKKRGSFLLHPSQTEVWALFKDSDLNWSSNPENYNEYKYEIVEVLSDFIADSGIRVCYLNKVGGFVSLFQRSSQSETDSFLIRPNELYRFSHNIPFSKMTGSERAGVPAGSFELDPASLPTNPYNLCYPGKDKAENKNVEHGSSYMVPNPPLGNVMKSEGSTAKETIDFD